MDYARPERAEALAAQYAAGTLRGPARRRFESLLAGHPALRAAVRAWERRLMPLSVALPPEEPPPHVWDGIERRLWPREAAPAPLPWWQRLGLWRGVSALAGAAALALAVLVVRPQASPPPVIVVLQGAAGTQAGSPAFVASFAGDGRSLVTRPLLPVSVAQDRTLELWALPPQGAPRSLGLISPEGVTVLPRERLPAAVLGPGTAALAVSLEPTGGSPTGAPTGPVLYSGRLQL
ncbi:anti-sigma factor [Azohydromonas aeria]|uniref:anti-sigma factor n=1 Tax=Azohydromonas aeria TaxID=2590212 RepID=UPI0012FC951B|nr:anti-sigma factor [Azohydromonas aeria]